MVDRQFDAAADGGLHAAHCGRLARRQGSPALPPVESTPLLGACPPRDHANYRSVIRPPFDAPLRTSLPFRLGLAVALPRRPLLSVRPESPLEEFSYRLSTNSCGKVAPRRRRRWRLLPSAA